MFSKQMRSAQIIALLSIGITAIALVFPSLSLSAALKGVAIWWDVLFPALFPFLVIAELMLGFGIVHFFGKLLDPMMRPLFGVPGIGGFVMAMGFASGYPVGARLTSQLWEQGLITRSEGERLVGFTTTSDPIFLIGATAVGFFQDATLAPILAISHYGAAILLGLAMRFIGKDVLSTSQRPTTKGFPLYPALQAMHRARILDGRPFGQLLQQAVKNSLQLLFVIGGLVVFFSVMIEVMTAAHVMDALYSTIQSLLYVLALPTSLSPAVANGIFEVTLGVKAAGAAGGGASLVSKVALAALMLSWGGLSVHAQIVSLLHHTPLRYSTFMFARAMHGLLSCILVFLLWSPLHSLRGSTATFLSDFTVTPGSLSFSGFSNLIAFYGLFVIAILICIPLLLLFASFIVRTLFYVRKSFMMGKNGD